MVRRSAEAAIHTEFIRTTTSERTSRSFGVEGDASSRGFAINLGVWVLSLSPRERAQAGHFCPAYASRYPPQANPQPDPVDSSETSRDVCAGTAFARWVTTRKAFAQYAHVSFCAARLGGMSAAASVVSRQGRLGAAQQQWMRQRRDSSEAGSPSCRGGSH